MQGCQMGFICSTTDLIKLWKKSDIVRVLLSAVVFIMVLHKCSAKLEVIKYKSGMFFKVLYMQLKYLIHNIN